MPAAGYTTCPYCAEEVRAEARKCKHCGEWLDGSRPAVTAAPQAVQKWETMEVEVERIGFDNSALALGSQIVGLSKGFVKWQFILRYTSPNRQIDQRLDEFSIPSKDDIETTVWGRQEDLLRKLSQDAVSQGWQLSRGPWWYSYSWRRPWTADGEAEMLQRFAQYRQEQSGESSSAAVHAWRRDNPWWSDPRPPKPSAKPQSIEDLRAQQAKISGAASDPTDPGHAWRQDNPWWTGPSKQVAVSTPKRSPLRGFLVVTGIIIVTAVILVIFF